MSTRLRARAHATVPVRVKTPPARIEDRLLTGTTRVLDVDVAGLEAALRATVRGEVRFTAADRGLYASDASNYRMVPLGVVLPSDAEDVVRALAAARRFGAPVFGRGGGTGIPGQTVNTGLLLDFSKYMNRLLELDPAARRARVEPGLVLDELRRAANVHGLTFGPDPATHSRCTLGGMIGNNSCGAHSLLAGETSDNIEELEVLTYEGLRLRVGPTRPEELAGIVAEGGRRGEIYARLRDFVLRHGEAIRSGFPRLPRRVSGYNLPALLPENGFHVARALVGSEGTCVFVLEATTRLVEWPRSRSLLVLGYDDIFHAADHVTDPLPFGPIALEALDDTFIADMKKKGMHPEHLDMMPPGHAWLLVEFGGATREESDAAARRLMDRLSAGPRPPSMRLFDDPGQEKLIWYLREEGLGATAKIPGQPENHEGWEDSSVAPERLGEYLRALKRLMDEFQYEGALYGHFGQGCVHTRLTFDLESSTGIERWRRFLGEAADLVVAFGGSLSGEHGDGQARGELLPRMYGPELIDAFREWKSIWDPEWRMNPGRIVEAYRVDENLRLGPTWRPPDLATHFEYPDDRHSFAVATERCVGAGVCRRHDGGTMCPSYMVTREEKHSTRGRARLLGEMVRGETVTEGWRSEAVREALDLCLACKGCKGECPVQVDVATYKAEFLSHYYEGRLRPRAAYTMGRIHRWARLASRAPRLVNLLSHAPLASGLAKLVAGMHPDRKLPSFAPYTFKRWFAARSGSAADEPSRRRGRAGSGQRVVLWPDTFNDHFHPWTAQAAVEVLEAAGATVEVPMSDLCCGRPLYDWGLLDEAKASLRRILDGLRPQIDAGLPFVVLEPSCASVFREELTNFFPRDDTARRLRAQTLLLGEFLARHAPDFRPPRLERSALLHGHCHQKAIAKLDDDERLLSQIGLQLDVPESGCCGMAGAFGFERGEKYEVSIRCGERVLLPAVRAAAPEAFVITDGFSCREQIAQTTARGALHLAEVVALALREAGPALPDYPERRARDVLGYGASWRR